MNTQKYAVAVSLLSSGLWHLYGKYNPQKIYNECISSEERKIQEYYSTWYSGDPLEEADKIIELCQKLNANIISYWDREYPPLLKEIAYPPAVIYCRGILPQKMCIAVVGTRNADTRSLTIAERLSAAIAQAGITVTSGLAIGIDREAHKGALKAGGSTIGVMANGIDMLYPASNRDIYTDIINSGNGCVISEYPPKVRISKWTFVRRNRIVSGMSAGTVVIKAGEKSGALITARYAVEQNRELFVCPGNSFDAGYKGCYLLLKEGAHPVYDESSIFEVLKIAGDVKGTLFDNTYSDLLKNTVMNLSVYDDDDIVTTLKNGAMDVDSLIRAVGKPSSEVLERLTTMELEGIIMRSGNLISLNSK